MKRSDRRSLTTSQRDRKELEVIHYAARGNIEKLKQLVSDGLSLTYGDYDNRTPLHLAASEGQFETVKFLIDHGVDINPVDRFGNTPIMDSLRHRSTDITKYLVSKGGKISFKSIPDTMDLCQAAKSGDMNKIQELVESGTDVNVGDFDSRTALQIAAAEGFYEIAEYLLKCGANVNVADRFGVTPLKEAIKRNHTKIIELFKNSGAITVEVSKFKSLPELVSSIQQVIIFLCEEQKWEYGAAWVLSDDRSQLTPSGAWYANGHHASKLAQYHHSQGPVPFGSGVVGSIAKTKEYLWIENKKTLQEKVFYPRSIKQSGFCSGFAFPILYNTELLAVIELYSFSERSQKLEIVQEATRTATSVIVTELLSHLSEIKKVNPLALSIKSEQSVVVFRIVLGGGTFSESAISSAVDWYYNHLGLPPTYFKIHSPHLIAKHLMAFMTAKLYAKDSGSPLSYMLEESDNALYFAESSSYETLGEHERSIEARYLGEGNQASKRTPEMGSMCVKYYLSTGTIDPNSTSRLAMYLVSEDEYINPNPDVEEKDINQVATGVFIRDVDELSRNRCQEAIRDNITSMTVSVNWYKDSPIPGCQAIHITYRRGTTHSYFSSLTTLMKVNKLSCPSKSIREFSNGLTQYIFNITGSTEDIANFKEQANLLYMLPRTSLFPLFEEEKLNAEEVVYAYAGWKFVYHFLNKASEEFLQLWECLKDDETNRNRLIRLKQTIRNEAATEAKVQQVIMAYPEIIKDCYDYFRDHFKPRENGQKLGRPSAPNNALRAKIERLVPNILDSQILQAFLLFNENIVKTNFYKSSKSALAVQLDPSFLPNDYPRTPYSIILFLGAEFRGFHVRFEPISRGGIRMIRSQNFHNFVKNAENLFLENYNLAYTQQRKNKDIPEGGSKGTILLSTTHQDKMETAFRKYIDSMLDLILVTATNKDPEIVDHFNQDDYIFCGPDEGTADVMDWAALHAKKRGYKRWSAFTTGKSPKLGGIPHDVYGMTTRGVHQYVLGIMNKKGIKEENVLKVQTGGPDGDLGSNEILISKDMTKAIVDGSGVLYDPQGINREELCRLAKARKMVENFDKKKISKDGFLVLLGDRDFVLPDGSKIENGTNFRNLFHLLPYAACDFFVPCGGRPESITIQNVNKLFVNGEPLFKNIVEGANLFFTQEARLVLEKAGVPVLKDASANKGGVTSSSLEVLAALCFTNEEHEQHMCVKDGNIPQFYREYVLEVQNKIEENARLEFECIWQENNKTKVPMSTVSDKLSEKINQLNNTITSSNLWNNEQIKKKVLSECFPHVLQNLLGLDQIVARLPQSYITATLSAHLASRYIYEFGLNPGEFSFFQFMQRYYCN